MMRWLIRIVVLGAIALALAQVVPYRVHDPKTRHEPHWDSPRTRQLAVAACFDCHSNETRNTWYENIAPISWWITNHVRDGRSKLNFSEWAPGKYEADEAVEAVREGSMPPSYYTWFGLHSRAELSAREREQLASGLEATLVSAAGGGRSSRR